VKKTSLGAEETINIKEFFTTDAALEFLKTQNYTVVAAELTDTAIALDTFQRNVLGKNRAIVLGNEMTGVQLDTLSKVDSVVKIPMI
jgi:tRNA G18 (ribose-2'-O)-methylase SpoU